MGNAGRRLARIAVVTILAICANCLTIGQLCVRAQVDRLTHPLLDDFETVVFADASILSETNSSSTTKPLLVPFADMLPIFERPSMGSQNIKNVILFARNFRPPKNLGLLEFDACYLVQFKEPVHLEFPSVDTLDTLAGIRIQGLPTTRVGSPRSSFFIAQLRDDEFLITTTLETAKLALRKLTASSPEGVSVIARLDIVNRPVAPFWMYRLYKSAHTSNPRVSGLVLDGVRISPDAVDLTFSLATSDEATLAYSTTNFQDTTPFQLNELGFSFRPTESNVWNSRIRLEDSEESRYRLYLVFCLFGFGAYI
jgi:hypothetical protein